jgi:tetratricopeptide (TPR) repeat protein
MAQNSIQALSNQAEKVYKAGKYEEAAILYAQAAASCRDAGDTLRAAELDNNLSVALLQAGNPQGALEAVQDTDKVFEEAGDTRRQALALGNQAAALEALDRLDEALATYRKCSDLLKSIDEQEYRSYVLKSISALQIRTGHQLEALASMDAALQNKKKLTLQERFLKKLLRVPIDMINRGG